MYINTRTRSVVRESYWYGSAFARFSSKIFCFCSISSFSSFIRRLFLSVLEEIEIGIPILKGRERRHLSWIHTGCKPTQHCQLPKMYRSLFLQNNNLLFQTLHFFDLCVDLFNGKAIVLLYDGNDSQNTSILHLCSQTIKRKEIG